MAYTALPDEPEEKVPRARRAIPPLDHRMRDFIDTHSPVDFIGLSIPDELRTQYNRVKGYSKSRKSKRLRRSKEITLTEVWLDLTMNYEKGAWQEAAPLYFFLKRVLEG